MITARLSTLRPATRVAIASTLIASLMLVATSCSEDDATAAPDTPAASDSPEPVDVIATDFHFDGLPGSVAVGTEIRLENKAPTELHELVAFRLPDEETRSAKELMTLPEAELGAILSAGPPSMVVLAAPGGEPINAIGDGTFREPGRYLLICSIPTGVDPDEYLAAAAESGDEPPQIPGGPPHFAHGMFAELDVTES